MNFVWECLWKTSLTTPCWYGQSRNCCDITRQHCGTPYGSVDSLHFSCCSGLLPLARQAPVVTFYGAPPAGPRCGNHSTVACLTTATYTAMAPTGIGVVDRWDPGHCHPSLACRMAHAGNSRTIQTGTGLLLRRGDSRLRSARFTRGLLRPVILLPQHALAWTSECLESVLAHEREHIRRFDCLSHWLAELVCATWWFHPLAWLARNRAAHERECACDDAVLRGGIRPSDYASELLHLASTMPKQGEPVMALSALSDFERRIRTMLSRRCGPAGLPDVARQWRWPLQPPS